MKALGLDLSTKSGIIGLRAGITPADHPEVIYARQLNAKLKGLERTSEIAAGVLEAVSEVGPDEIVIEDYAFGVKPNKSALVTLVEIGTIVRYFLRQHGYAYCTATTNQVKKFATGQGNAAKDQVMMGIFKRFGFEAPTSDQADAFALAGIGLLWRGALQMPKSHLVVQNLDH